MDPTTAECDKRFRGSLAELTSIVWPQVIRYTRARVGRRFRSSRSSSGWDFADAVARIAHAAAIEPFVDEPFVDTDTYTDTAARVQLYSVIVRVVRAELAHDAGQSDAMFDNIDPVAQEVMILRVIVGLTVFQTATVLEVPAGRVRLLQHQAMRSLELQAG